jgi:hypothetical protein
LLSSYKKFFLNSFNALIVSGGDRGRIELPVQNLFPCQKAASISNFNFWLFGKRYGIIGKNNREILKYSGF